MPALLLQKPTFKSTAKNILSACQGVSHNGSWVNLILCEASTIQAKPSTNRKGLYEEQLANAFAKFVLEGKINRVVEAYFYPKSK